MSYAMGYCTPIRVEASIPVGDFIFEIMLVHVGGWTGDIKHDYNELQIVKCLKFTEKQLQVLAENNINLNLIKYMQYHGQTYLGVERIENSEYDRGANDIELDQYKEAIKKFRSLAVFI